jgi:hypothetical protein
MTDAHVALSSTCPGCHYRNVRLLRPVHGLQMAKWWFSIAICIGTFAWPPITTALELATHTEPVTVMARAASGVATPPVNITERRAAGCQSNTVSNVRMSGGPTPEVTYVKGWCISDAVAETDGRSTRGWVSPVLFIAGTFVGIGLVALFVAATSAYVISRTNEA